MGFGHFARKNPPGNLVYRPVVTGDLDKDYGQGEDQQDVYEPAKGPACRQP